MNKPHFIVLYKTIVDVSKSFLQAIRLLHWQRSLLFLNLGLHKVVQLVIRHNRDYNKH
jgi:hypothetical protein